MTFRPDGDTLRASSMHHPEITKGNIHAAAVSDDLTEVERILREHPTAATERASLDDEWIFC